MGVSKSDIFDAPFVFGINEKNANLDCEIRILFFALSVHDDGETILS